MIQSLQDQFAPNSICFGCGPANPEGLRIKSYISGNNSLCDWTPDSPHREAFPGILCGGIIGSLLDCHSNWTAAWHLMVQNAWQKPRCTVTASYSVKLLAPTPSNYPVHLKAWIEDSGERRVQVQAELYSKDKLCATCDGVFVAVKKGHPAFHRWN